MLYGEMIAVFFLESVENVHFVMVGLVVHKVTTGLSANKLNRLNGVIRNSGRKPNALAGFVPTLCARKIATECHTCRHIVGMCDCE
jgi:hypothetical protein